MAAIETITGITKLDESSYTVTSNVNVGGGIDNITNAIFRIHTGGLLKFRADCNTVFTRCLFIEEASALNAGTDNFNGGANCRFAGGATCAPVFRGCTWIINNGSSRRDFDMAATTAPSFLSDEFGNSTYIRVASPSTYNHFASEAITINGLVMDTINATAIEFIKPPPNIQNLVLVDGGQNFRHLAVLVNLWSGNDTVSIRGLSARNIALFDTGSTLSFPGRIVQLIDPDGDITKDTERANSAAGVLRVLRTYSLKAFDVSAQSSLLNSRIVITGSTNAVVYDQDLETGLFSNTLLDYSQAAASTVVASEGSYRRALVKYGYQSAISSITLNPEDFGLNGLNDGSVLMFPDDGISQAVKATVDAYSVIDTLDQLYDRSAAFAVDRIDRHNVGVSLMSSNGSQLTLDGTSLTINSSASEAFAVSGSTITIKPTTLLGNGTRFNSLGFVSGTLDLVQGGNYTGLSAVVGASATVTVPDGTTDLSPWIFASGATINLRAGATAATVIVGAGQDANITAGAGVIIESPTNSIVISGIPAVTNAILAVTNLTTDVVSYPALTGGGATIHLDVGTNYEFAADAPGYLRQAVTLPGNTPTFEFNLTNYRTLYEAGISRSADIAFNYSTLAVTVGDGTANLSFADVFRTIEDYLSTESGVLFPNPPYPVIVDVGGGNGRNYLFFPYDDANVQANPVRILPDPTNITDPTLTDFVIVLEGATAPLFDIFDFTSAGGRTIRFQTEAVAAVVNVSGGLSTEDRGVIDGIKAKTDQLAFTVANQVDANALSGGGGATINAQDVADALKLAPAAGTPAEGSVYAELNSLQAGAGGTLSYDLPQFIALLRADAAFKRVISEAQLVSGLGDELALIKTQVWTQAEVRVAWNTIIVNAGITAPSVGEVAAWNGYAALLPGLNFAANGEVSYV